MRTFHLPLSDDLHNALRLEATAAHRPATELVRDALAAWLEARRRQRIDEELERYARAEAGGPMDLDAELEAAGVELLVQEQAS